MTHPAKSFDNAAEEYEAARPTYPGELLDVLPVARDASVLDLGAGTGKLTRLLVRRYQKVYAVEPLENMRAILARVVPEAEAMAGSAEAIPLADASVDAVFAAQAFHWFATDEVVAEIARVLRPGGIFADVFNETVEPYPYPPAYHARLEEIFGQPRVGAEDDQRVLVIERGPFRDLQTTAVAHEQVQSREQCLTFMRSISYVAKLPPEEQETLMAELAELLPPGDYRFLMTASARWAVRT